MAKRIFWKKGMRLTDELLTKSDACTFELVGKALALGAAGNFGLFPDTRPFNLSLDIEKNTIEVVSLNCLGIARDGSLIDVHYDSGYTNSFCTKAVIPDTNLDAVYYLCICLTGEWKETTVDICEPVYSFCLIGDGVPVPSNALPIARIVYDEHSWRMDDINFAPPCLFLSSLDKYEDYYQRFKQLLINLDSILPKKFLTERKDALKIYWPIVQQLSITVDKEKDIMSPMVLLGLMQKCVSGFVLACSLDESISIGEPAPFLDYVKIPYSFKNVYKDIRIGFGLCSVIFDKVNGFEEPQQLSSPIISSDQLDQKTKTGKIKLVVTNIPDGAVLYYSVDGSEPSIVSTKGTTLTIDAHFKSDKNPEPDKRIMVKVRYELSGSKSTVGSYTVNVHKDHKSYICI